MIDLFRDFDIKNQEDFDESIFAGADRLLKMQSFDNCLVAVGKDEEEANETYYFIEENGRLVDTLGDLALYELEEKMFVLLTYFSEENYIVIRKQDKKEIEEMF